MVIVSGCGKAGDKNRCDGVSCESGVCSPDSGECVNASQCADDDECVGGFQCLDGDCAPQFACEVDGSCDRGVCENGACVNAGRCDADVDCVPGYACDGDVCIVDACDLVTCNVGVCDKETGNCVNATVCTAETSSTDCLPGFTCYDQSCANEADVCADLDCDRGTCSFRDLECANTIDCAGDDLNCLEGFFCDINDTCRENACDDGGNCARGVCDPATGACVNDSTCDDGNDCVDAFFCVANVCVDQVSACNTCDGNQLCRYDEATLSIQCEEDPDGCTTSIDCVGDRECQAGACGPPGACVPDALEPNDTPATATNWFDVASGVLATLCVGDADYYEFDVARDPQFTGTLIGSIAIPREDIGIGTVTLELLDESGMVVASQTSLATDTSVRVEYQIGNINQGVYTLAVTDTTLSGGGIQYKPFMDLAEDATVSMCRNAPTLSGTQSGDTSTSTSNGLGATCAIDGSATEDAWMFEITEPSYVEITVTSAEFDVTANLRTQCEADASEVACANTTSAGAETIATLLQPDTYFLIVQGATGADSGGYSVTLTQTAVVCTPADNTCIDMMTASECNGSGTGFDSVACDAGCDMTIGACMREMGAVCSTAIDATGGFVGSVDLSRLDADYDPGTACVPLGFYNVTEGPDAVFAVTLQPGDVAVTSATPAGFDDVGIFVMTNCSDPTASCLAGANDNSFSTAEQLAYTNNTMVSQDVFIVIDSQLGTTQSVDVEIVVGQAICTPGMQQCAGDTLETCNATGTAYDTRLCGFGCDATMAACIPPPNDTCGAGSIDISAGGTFSGTIDDFANDYEVTNTCTGFASTGAEATYVLTGTPGDVVTITLDAANYDTSLYAVTDCANIGGTCLAGDDSVLAAEEIEFVIPDANPIFVVADAFSSSPSGTYTMEVTIRTPDCSNYGEAVGCSDANTLQYCDSLGFFADYPCATTCTAGACDQPSGDRCFDAVDLTVPGSAMGSFSDNNATIDPGVGTCILNNSQVQDGSDGIYRLNLVAGDLLTASLTTSHSSAGMYILDDCKLDVSDSCLWAQPVSDTLQFYVPSTGQYFLVVDTTSTIATGTYTLDVAIDPIGAVCQPGGSQCANNTLTVCSDDGTQVDAVINCPNGCAGPTACAASANVNDTCVDAELVTGPVIISDTYARFTNTFDPGQTTPNACDLSGFQTDGPDSVYAVTLGAGDVVEVSVDDLGAFDSPAVYIATDCNDTENTCLASDVAGPVARTGYVSEFGETVYVIVDNSGATNDDPFVLDIDVRLAECTPSLNSCFDVNTRQYCDQFGRLQSQNCFFGCSNGACNPPTNDSCSMPFDATAGGTFDIPWTGYMNDYGSSGLTCTGFAASGPEAVYSVTAATNDRITARLSSAGADTSLWITTTCGDEAACVIGDDAFGSTPEEVIYTVPSDGTYYIMADAFSTTPSGEFNLEIIVESPTCTPLTATCDGANQNVEVCVDAGYATQVLACDNAGCNATGPTCNTATGEHPAAAIDANALGAFTGNFAAFQDDFDIDSSVSCTGFETPGADAAYFVDLTMGQVLTATLNAPNDDTALYIMSGLADPGTTCLVGDDAVGSAETVSYTATADMRVYVIADAFDSDPTDMFTLTLSVQ